MVKDYRYDTFGREETPESKVFGGKQTGELWRAEVEKIDNPFRYAGEYLDEETGNYYLWARYYDPGIQRFVNEDSYGVEHGASWIEHLYGYAGNNPVRFTDPTGHYISDWDKQHLNNNQLKTLEKLGSDYADAATNGDENGKKRAHQEAEAIRNIHRNSNEIGTADGNTINKRSNSKDKKASSISVATTLSVTIPKPIELPSISLPSFGSVASKCLGGFVSAIVGMLIDAPPVGDGTITGQYPPAKDHTTTKERKIPEKHRPNSSIDKVDDAGNVIRRRWYDKDGRAERDVDFTDHGNPKQHPKVPHEHKWDWSDPNKPKHIDGSE